MFARQISAVLIALFVATLFAVPGCVNLRTIQPSPWTYSQQHEGVLEIAPLGTPREDAVERLTEAGIAGSFGISESIYYCDIWQRPDGARWHLNLALYFDEAGELYDIRPGQADTGPFTGAITTEESADEGPPSVYDTANGRADRLHRN